jgi:hypothetical protein
LKSWCEHLTDVYNKSITTHPQKRMNSTYIVRGGLQECPTHFAKQMICWVLGLEVEVGLQIGVVLQVGAPAPKQKRSPLNNKGRTPYSSPISKVPMRFILLLFLPCFITMYTSHGWVTRLANQVNSTYCEDDPPCILWDGW